MAHAMEAHHNEVEPQTVEAVIVQIVDALSGARPGARGESLEHYVKRLHELEAIAVPARRRGQGLRDARGPRDPRDRAPGGDRRRRARRCCRTRSPATSRSELEYPGQIKVTVIRESRATDYAR